MKRTVIAAAAAVLTLALFCGCAGNDTGAAADDTVQTDETVSSADIDVSALFENNGTTASAQTEAPVYAEGENTFATVTDVENEVDRAIYKARVTLPGGWVKRIDSAEGKFYESPLGTLMIKAQNFGSDAELQTLEKFADSIAANITMNNMYNQADTEFGEPKNVTVAGLPAIAYDYSVTAYIFIPDDENDTSADAQMHKEIYGEFKDELYILYSGTDAYVLLFESPKGVYDTAKPQFDEIRESFAIDENGEAGYEEAQSFLSSQAAEAESFYYENEENPDAVENSSSE